MTDQDKGKPESLPTESDKLANLRAEETPEREDPGEFEESASDLVCEACGKRWVYVSYGNHSPMCGCPSACYVTREEFERRKTVAKASAALKRDTVYVTREDREALDRATKAEDERPKTEVPDWFRELYTKGMEADRQKTKDEIVRIEIFLALLQGRKTRVCKLGEAPLGGRVEGMMSRARANYFAELWKYAGEALEARPE